MYMTNEKIQPWHLSFWSPRRVSARFESGAMPKSEKYVYLLISAALWAALAESSYLLPRFETLNLYDYLTSGIALLSVPIGAWYLYSLHKSESSFVEKYLIVGTSASFHILFLIVVPALIFMTILVVLFGGSSDLGSTSATLTGALIDLVLTVLIYMFLGRYFKQDNDKSAE
ncbi:MAG: hypothetical protein ACI9VM_000664 [Candidatus Azotimanducaceae bacterium]|jgi:hypothetical protein